MPCCVLAKLTLTQLNLLCTTAHFLILYLDLLSVTLKNRDKNGKNLVTEKLKGLRTMTLRAGKLTPEERVEVAISIRRIPCLNEFSTMSRSSNVRPEIK